MYDGDPIDPKTGLRGFPKFSGQTVRYVTDKQLLKIAKILYWKEIPYTGSGTTKDAYSFIQDNYEPWMHEREFDISWVSIDKLGHVVKPRRIRPTVY